jgi:hypothetical protein
LRASPKSYEANGLFTKALREMTPDPPIRRMLLAGGRLLDEAEAIANQAPPSESAAG